MALPTRKIASNLFWSEGRLIRNPLLEVDVDGHLLSLTICEQPDRMAATEFYAGVIVAQFPDDYRNAFARMLAAGGTLCQLLGNQPAGSALVVISGLDYASMRLTPDSQIRRL